MQNNDQLLQIIENYLAQTEFPAEPELLYAPIGYSLAGGVYDALKDATGDIYMISNDELDYWKEKFLSLEGVDIYSAAAVAVASLDKAVKDGAVRKDELIMLNITGGGEKLAKSHKDVVYAEPDLVLDPALSADEIISKVEKLF